MASTSHCGLAGPKEMYIQSITPVRQALQSVPTQLKLNDSMDKPPTPASHTPTFSTEEEILYTRRFEEGYDLLDPKYKAWLSINHPTADTVSDNMAPLPIVGSSNVSTPSTPVGHPHQ